MRSRTARALPPLHICNASGLSRVHMVFILLSIVAVYFVADFAIIGVKHDLRQRAICAEMCDLNEKWIVYKKSGPDLCMCKESGKWIHKADLPK